MFVYGWAHTLWVRAKFCAAATRCSHGDGYIICAHIMHAHYARAQRRIIRTRTTTTYAFVIESEREPAGLHMTHAHAYG